jgi:hypothetical protein
MKLSYFTIVAALLGTLSFIIQTKLLNKSRLPMEALHF